jgi:hypothetical protein
MVEKNKKQKTKRKSAFFLLVKPILFHNKCTPQFHDKLQTYLIYVVVVIVIVVTFFIINVSTLLGTKKTLSSNCTLI